MPKLIAHVEDDQDIRDMVCRVLNTEGYRVESYSSVGEFIKSLHEGTILPDLIILDVMVESDDAGLFAVDTVNEKHPQIPILLLTTLGEIARPYLEKHSSLIRIMEKPFFPDDLKSAVFTQIEGAGALGI